MCFCKTWLLTQSSSETGCDTIMGWAVGAYGQQSGSPGANITQRPWLVSMWRRQAADLGFQTLTDASAAVSMRGVVAGERYGADPRPVAGRVDAELLGALRLPDRPHLWARMLL